MANRKIPGQTDQRPRRRPGCPRSRKKQIRPKARGFCTRWAHNRARVHLLAHTVYRIRTRMPVRAHQQNRTQHGQLCGQPVSCWFYAVHSYVCERERASERSCVCARECTVRPGGPRLPGPPEPPSPCRPPRPRASEAARHVRMRTSTRNARARTGAGTHAGGVCRGGRLWLSSARNSAHAFDVTKMCTDS